MKKGKLFALNSTEDYIGREYTFTRKIYYCVITPPASVQANRRGRFFCSCTKNEKKQHRRDLALEKSCEIWYNIR